MTHESSTRTWPWMLGAFLLVLVGAIALRHATNILDKDAIFDERYIRLPIDDLLARGWSVETAIDFTETKGPTLIWAYAVGGELVGPDLNGLRLVSVVFFVLGAVPLLLICRHCGLPGPALPLVAGFYVLLPQNPVVGQLLMSEPSFVCGSLWLLWAFIWGFGDSIETQRSIAGPVAVGVILAILLHLRIHAVAFAAAMVFVAAERDRRRSWPWWVACAVAGLSRVPLMIRWGGLVSPEYQSAHGLGLNMDSMTYLAAALVPMTAVLLWPGRRKWILTGAAVGLLLAIAAAPSFTETIHILDWDIKRYLGFVVLALRRITDSPGVTAMLVGALAVTGAAAMGALGSIAWQRPAVDRLGVVYRLQFWTLVIGCCLYGMTDAVVYDRYLLSWAVLMPIVWVTALPRTALGLQGALLLTLQCWYVWRLLIRT